MEIFVHCRHIVSIGGPDNGDEPLPIPPSQLAIVQQHVRSNSPEPIKPTIAQAEPVSYQWFPSSVIPNVYIIKQNRL